MSIMSCPSCMASMTGYWQHQIAYLVSCVIDNLFRSNVPEEMIALETMVPREYRMDQWVHVVREDFHVISDRKCPVINQLLSDSIIEERNLPAYKRSHRSLQEPITGVILQMSEHASEVFSGTSDYYCWTHDFRVSVEGRMENGN